MATVRVETVRVEGLRELDAALKEFSRATARNVVRRALNRAAQPIRDAAERLAPRATGFLARSLTIGSRASKAGQAEFARAMAQGLGVAEARSALRSARRTAKGEASALEIYIGPLRKAYYAHMVEFGTSRMAPRPFMRPAWDANKRKALELIKSELAAEIEKARKRAARKALKLQRR